MTDKSPRVRNPSGPTQGGRIPTARRTLILTLVALASACAESAEVGPTGIEEQRPVVAIQTAELPTGEVGQPYNAILRASGGSGSYTWTLTSGELPEGLGLSSSGVIEGTPTKADSGAFTVRATDGNGNSKDQKLSLKVKGGPPRIETRSLPNAVVGTPYLQSLEAGGGAPPYVWDVADGTLPPGLALSAEGEIGGTPTEGGARTFSVRITDSAGDTDTWEFTLQVESGASGPVISTGTLPAGVVGAAYSGRLEATGGSQPYGWSRAAGSLPDGLTLASDGTISGTPSVAGSGTFTARVSDNQGLSDTRQFTIDVAAAPEPPTIETSSLPGGQVGSTYSVTLSATGGAPAYSWSLASGSLPAGLSLSGDGVISGTPTSVETGSFTVRVTDQNGLSDTQALSIAVSAEPQPPVIQTSSLPAGQVDDAYSVTLEASGGAPGYTWDLAGGSLPAGLSLSGSGTVSGTPSSAGTSSFTVRVTDQNGLTDTRGLSIEVAAAPEPPSIQTTSLPDGEVGSSYSASLQATGGTPAYTWSVASGSLPAGLSLGTGGAISGTPASGGTSSFTVRVTDQNGLSDTRALSIDVAAAPQPPSIQTTSLPGGSVGASYSATLQASGGTPAYSWSLASGSLPAGLSLGTSGQISGTPTTAGSSSFTVRVTDQNGLSDTQALSIEVASQSSELNILTTSLPQADLGRAYSASLVAEGGSLPYVWGLYNSQLPAGLSLSDGGVISGTPTVTGTFGFTVLVTDANGDKDAQGVSIRIVDQPNQRPTAEFSVTCTELSCAMQDQSSDPDGSLASWFWDLGDGSTSTAREPTHRYAGTGAYVVTLTVTDDEGASSSTSKTVAVSADEQPGFQIDLYFDASVPERMRNALREAADHWERIIGDDLTAYGPFEERTAGDRCDRPYIPFIDDLAIVVKMVDFSGSTLARAGPCIIRTSGAEANRPVYGSVEIDTGASGWTFDKAVEILKHEVGHILGIGPAWRPLIQAPCGENGETPYFAEPNAVREFSFASGRTVDRVYVQMGMVLSGECRPGGHWGDLMESELMSPSTSLTGPIQPLSRVTIGALEDLGWTVDYSQADPFAPRDAGALTGAALHEQYSDIVAPGPLLPDPGPRRR